MQALRAFRQASLAVLAGVALGLSGTAGAAVAVDAEGVYVQGPEAPAPAPGQAAKGHASETVVVMVAKHPTNLRKAPAFLAVLGAASFR